MKRPTNNLDPELDQDEQRQPLKQELGRSFSFRGKPLAKYSFAHRAALFRFGNGTSLRGFEECIYLVFMLLTQKPEDIDLVRSAEDLAAFRLAAGEWAEKENVTDGKGWNEVHDVYAAILKPVETASAAEQVPTIGGKTSKTPND